MLEQQDDWNNNSINEHRALGLYLKYNPQKMWQQKLDPNNLAVNLADLNRYINNYVQIYGIIINVKTIITKTQKLMAFLKLQNNNNIVEVTVFDKLYQTYQEFFQINKVILIDAKVEVYEEKINLLLLKVIAKI